MVAEQSLTTMPMCQQPVSAFTLVRLLVPLMAGCEQILYLVLFLISQIGR